MPIYEYRCEQCGDLFEVRQSFKDEPITVHEKCGGRVERLLSVPALQFKGSGFYINDYAKGGNSASSNTPAKNEGSGAKDGTPASTNSGEKAAAPAVETKASSSDSKEK